MSHLGELASAYLDGEATPEEAGLVVAHMADCASCRSELEVLVEARRAVRSLPMMDLPEGLLPDEGRADGVRRWRVAVAAAAAVVVIAAAAMGLGSTDTVQPDDLVAPHVELMSQVGAQGGTP